MRLRLTDGPRPAPLAWALLGVLVLLVLAQSLVRVLDHDEFEALQAAWKIHQGQRIYVDFFQLHHPLYYYTIQPFFWAFGDGPGVVTAVRLFQFAQLLAMLALTYAIAREVVPEDRTVAVVATFFLASITMFVSGAFQIRPDVPQTLFGLLAVLLLLRWFRVRAPWLLVAGGLSLGLSFLYLQKAVVLVLLLAAVMGLRLLRRDVRLRDGLVLGGAAAAPVLLYALYLAVDGSLATHVFWNFTFPSRFFAMGGRDDMGLALNVERMFGANGLILFLFLVATCLVAKDRRQWELWFIGVGWLAWWVVVSRHLVHYYLLALPMVAITAALGLRAAFGERRSAIAAALIFTLLPPSLVYVRHIVRGRDDQMARIAYVRSVAGAGDYVFDPKLEFTLFRDSPDFFYFYGQEPTTVEVYRTFADYPYDVAEIVARYEPKVISERVVRDAGDDARIAERYAPVPGYEGVYVRREEAGGPPVAGGAQRPVAEPSAGAERAAGVDAGAADRPARSGGRDPAASSSAQASAGSGGEK